MAVIPAVLEVIFGRNGNILRETAEVFRENAEAGAQRAQDRHSAAMAQFAAEFTRPRQSRFDCIMDGLNRLPRPMLALGTIALMASALADPIWFANRMQGLALVPEPLWWLLGVIVSFYFAARHQIKAQDHSRGLVASLARAPAAARNIAVLNRSGRQGGQTPASAGTGTDAAAELASLQASDNPALQDWLAARG